MMRKILRPLLALALAATCGLGTEANAGDVTGFGNTSYGSQMSYDAYNMSVRKRFESVRIGSLSSPVGGYRSSGYNNYGPSAGYNNPTPGYNNPNSGYNSSYGSGPGNNPAYNPGFNNNPSGYNSGYNPGYAPQGYNPGYNPQGFSNPGGTYNPNPG